jgi:hypothetical protein
VLSETGEGKVFEEWMGEASVFGFEILPRRRKGSALKNPAGALHTDGVGCTLSAGREVKMEIPDKTKEANRRKRRGTGILNLILSLRVVACIALCLAVPNLVNAVTFSVNSNFDFSDAFPGDGVCATALRACTLRAAIEESNHLPGQQHVINLQPGTYMLTAGELQITEGLVLNGNDPNSTIIDGGHFSRVFLIISSGVTGPSVNISGVTIRNGKAPSDVLGGGIFINAGSSLSLFNCIVSENESDIFGAGISNAGFLQIFNSTVTDNRITGDTSGGGVTASGGGIFNFSSGTVEIDRSTISANQATRGAGIDNQGHLEITNSTISGNMAFGGGGGIRNTSTATVSGSGTAFIAFSTITNNVANLGAPDEAANRKTGGGILNFGTVSIGNTILADNTDNRFSSNDLFSPDCFSRTDVFNGTFTSFRGNLVGVVNTNCNVMDTIFGDTLFDLVGTAGNPLDPRFELDFTGKPRLFDNGGPTETHALRSDSPAVDQGTGVTSASFFDCPATDQRGFARPVDGNGDGKAACDIGAFEFGAIPPVSSCATDVSGSIHITRSGYGYNFTTGRVYQTVTLTNSGSSVISAPISLVLDDLSSDATLFNINGNTACASPFGSPVINLSGPLNPGAAASVVLQFTDPTRTGIGYTTRVLAGSGNR